VRRVQIESAPEVATYAGWWHLRARRAFPARRAAKRAGVLL